MATTFFINSSELLTLSLLNNKNYFFSQEQMANCIGCTQPNISTVISSLIDKGFVEVINGGYCVNQYLLIEELVRYAKNHYNCNIVFCDKMVKLQGWFPEIYAFFCLYLRLFNIDYVITECNSLSEICFVFSQGLLDLRDIDT